MDHSDCFSGFCNPVPGDGLGWCRFDETDRPPDHDPPPDEPDEDTPDEQPEPEDPRNDDPAPEPPRDEAPEPFPEPEPEPEPESDPQPDPEPGFEIPEEPDERPDGDACVQMGSYDLTQPGPYSVTTRQVGRVNIYEPTGRPNGCKMPIFHFSNGTGAFCAFYGSILRHLASYGYLATCYETTQSGSGEACTSAIETALSSYAGDVYTDRFLSSGHSQGGGASHTCHYLLEQAYPNARVVSASVQPAHGMNRASYTREYPIIEGPVFMMSGTRDTLVADAWIARGYALIESEKHWYVAQEATHFNPHGWANTSVLSFGQWKLFGDEAAGDYFLALPNYSEWQAR